MTYVDGFVMAVKTAKKDEYRAFAERTWPMIRDLGALALRECWGDDVPEGKLTSFPMAVKLEPDETVVFSWIEWPDRATRDAGMKVMMDDQEMASMTLPFDGPRMIFGGFAPLVWT